MNMLLKMSRKLEKEKGTWLKCPFLYIFKNSTNAFGI